jgi:hypothetical protein
MFKVTSIGSTTALISSITAYQHRQQQYKRAPLACRFLYSKPQVASSRHSSNSPAPWRSKSGTQQAPSYYHTHGAARVMRDTSTACISAVICLTGRKGNRRQATYHPAANSTNSTKSSSRGLCYHQH